MTINEQSTWAMEKTNQLVGDPIHLISGFGAPLDGTDRIGIFDQLREGAQIVGPGGVEITVQATVAFPFSVLAAPPSKNATLSKRGVLLQVVGHTTDILGITLSLIFARQTK